MALIDRAECLESLAEPAKAGPPHVEAIEIRRRKAGNDDPETLDAVGGLGRCYLQEKFFDKAESLLQDCLAVRQKLMPDDWRRFHTELLL